MAIRFLGSILCLAALVCGCARETSSKRPDGTPTVGTTPEGARTYPPTGREAPKNIENQAPTGAPSTTSKPTPSPATEETKSRNDISSAPGSGGSK